MTHDISPELAELTPDQRELLLRRLGRRQPRPTRLPLSPTQEQLWFLDRMDPGTAVYNVPFAFRLRGALDVEALRSALNAVAARQEALRLVFAEDETGPHQLVRADVDIPLPVADLRDLSAAARDAEVAEHGRVSFDLRTGPLLAARLLVLADDEHLLLVTVHHIVYDAWSGDVFTTELVAYYGQFAGGVPAALPPLRATFADHARRQRDPAFRSEVDAQVAQWRDRLAGAPPTSTPRPDRARPVVQTHRGGRHSRLLPAALTGAMGTLAQEAGATLNAVALAGFAAALRQVTGQDDLLLGMPAAGRSRVELEPLIGSFANMLVLRLDLSGDPAVRELVRRAHRTVGEAVRHQDAPYARVVEELAPPRDPGINPLFQVLFTVADTSDGTATAAGVEFAPQPVDNQLTDFDLFVTLSRRDDECELVLDYNADLYLADTVERLADRVVAALTGMVRDAGAPLGSVPELRRDVIALAGTFTTDLAAAPLQFWLDFAQLPAAVERVPYGQLVRHLLTGGEAAATVVLLRWEDWLRQWKPGTGEPSAVLGAAMRDLETAVAAHRQRTDAPLVFVRCPASPRATGHAVPFARLDDRLALLAARIPGVTVDWAEENPVPVAHDPAADDLGHLPYTPEYFAALAGFAARRLPAPEAAAERAAYRDEYLTDPAEVAERVALRAVSSSADSAPPAEPATPAQRRLADIWREVLGVAEVGANSDFFALGGHSLLATQLLSRLQREFGREISLYTLFTHPTVAQLTLVLDEAGAAADEPMRPAPPDAEPAASSIQQRLWATSRIDREDARHNTTFAAVLRGVLDEGALERAVAEIVRRHDVLRTTFAEHRGRPRPVVHAEMACWCEPADLAEDPEGAIEAMSAFPYDLDEGPLLRVRLLRAGAREHYLLVGMHHIICDATSWGIFLDELATLYDAYTAGLPSPLPRPPLQFGDFAHHQQAWLAGDDVETHIAYWREKLRGAPAPLELPGDAPGCGTEEVAGRAVRRFAAGAAVRELARAESVTPYSVLLAVYAVLLYQESGQPDVLIGMPTSGRDRAELEGVIGCFADLLPLRLDVGGRPNFRRLVRRLHSTVKDAQAHQRLPFPKIMEALRLPRDSARHPLKCVLNYADAAEETLSLPGIEVEPLPVGAAGADFDVLFTLDWQDGDLQADLTYASELFSRDRAEGLVDRFGELLAELVAAPDTVIGDVPAVEPAPDRAALAIGLATSFRATRVVPTVEFWSELLGEPAWALVTAPAGQVLRPLLDPAGPFRAGALNVVLLRWEDWRPGAALSGVTALERDLDELCEAVAVHRARTGAQLLLGVSAAAPDARWARIFDGLTQRLRGFAESVPDVAVLDLDDWARRYDVTSEAEFETAAATAVVRWARRPFHPPVPALVLDPAGFAEPDLIRVVREQLGRRDVVLTAEPSSAELAALVTIGALRVGAAEGYPLHPEHPAGHVWPLDEPADGAAQPLPADLVADIATRLNTAARIATAVGSGFRRTAQRTSAAPRTDRERALAGIWAEVLHLPEVGIHDDFYELGGDSLLAITVAFHAAEAGIRLSARQLTENRTIAELGLDAGTAPVAAVTHEVAAGEQPLTPAQLWWFETVASTMDRPAWFNHPYYLELRRPVAVEHLEEAVRRLAAHHDSLRLRFRRDGEGVLWQHHADVEGGVPFASHETDDEDAIAELAAAAQLTLDLADGPTCRVLHFAGGGTRPDRLLIIAHHLVVDAISRDVLLGDLQTLCGRLERGEEPSLPAKTTAYTTWARRLSTKDMSAELPFWRAQAPTEAASLPADLDGVTTMGASAMLSHTLSTEETDGLHEVTRRRRVNVRDLIVWAVTEAVAARTGGRECALATTGHGREDLFPDVDLHRTTGWFQVMYPVLLRLPDGGDPVAAIAAQLARVPNNGIGHGMLKFTARAPGLTAIAEPRLAVNYMGTFGFDEVTQAEELFEVCKAPYGETEDGTGAWPYDLDVGGVVVGGRLRIDVGYGTAVYRAATATAFLEDVTARLLGLLA
ncbi:hypothetical protein DMA12_18205 [Amycolatopsis balhimycina DSM 5908]|uniref:Carrier domain-containing protein n=1 Tax=Amycolatopsis balhimycina DSM 5908 TaxID=1081091 RepID=A0A428WL72_AMYBA|nr:condensation domain-containing protein [Amycolatopsis balhimycina]RSM43808.1 hypothetical protein DMA12_18205 [Amycolatopsis balhimycina DSM 5908]